MKMMSITGLSYPKNIALGTTAEAFTYQGRLFDGNSPAEGAYDFEFKLFDDPTTGSRMGMAFMDDIHLANGYFTAELELAIENPDIFNGEPCWLEIAVRWGQEEDPWAFVTLNPRQQITPTPYAMHAGLAQTAEFANGVTSGAVDSNALADGAVTNMALASNAVDSNNLNTDAVTSNKIQDGTIVDADISATASIA